MTRGGVKEYLEAVQGRYQRATRQEKGRMLDEFVGVTGHHRKAAIRLLARGYGRAPHTTRDGPRNTVWKR